MPEARGNATYEPLGDDLFQLTLTRENKAEIFEYALTKLSDSLKESSSILQNLNAWDPSVASLFTQRSPSTVLDTPFRLIYPKSAFSYFDETGLYVRQYVAISYCWRSPELLPEGYERDGSWPISKPFADAILNDKDHPREGIWMDQLCIIQTSDIDKQKSVAAMDVIYRSCIRLIVLLEDVFLEEREVALSLKYDPTKMKFDRTWKPEEGEKDAFVSFYKKVNSARWWERAWCFHEFSVNEPWSDKRQCNTVHNATFIMNGPGGTTVKMKWFVLHLLMGSGLHLLTGTTPDVLGEFKGQGIFTNADRYDDRKNGLRSSLMARHNSVAQKGCTMMADRLSIMINMCGLGLAYVGGALKTREEVLYINSLLALAAGEVYPLTMFEGKSLTLGGGPTWLSRSTTADDTTIPGFKIRLLNGIHRISPREIELDVLFLNNHWRMINDKDIAPTYEVFSETIKTTQPEKHILGSQRSDIAFSRPDTAVDGFRRSFLAGCISNGYRFTARLWTQLYRDVVLGNYNTGLFKDLTPNPSLHTAAERLIAKLFPVSTLLGIPPPPDFTINDAQLFLTWLTDPRSIYYMALPTIVESDIDGNQVFVTGVLGNENFNDGPVEELSVAVPTDLLNASCIPSRVWILRPGKGERRDDKWRIVGKGLLLGEPDLMREAKRCENKEDTGVRLRARTIVGG